MSATKIHQTLVTRKQKAAEPEMGLVLQFEAFRSYLCFIPFFQ